MHTIASEVKHTFELSGLGKPPYGVVHPQQHAIEKGQTFWCEHCGTAIINRHFIKSSDSKVSVVGIDCLRKTGDQGLIEGVKLLKREEKAKAKQAEFDRARESQLADERAANNGLTNTELSAQVGKGIETKIRDFIVTLDDNPVVSSLTGIGFEMDMAHQAYLVRPYTPGQLAAIKKAYTRKVSKARVNQVAYKEAFPRCEQAVNDLQIRITAVHQELEQMRDKARLLQFG